MTRRIRQSGRDLLKLAEEMNTDSTIAPEPLSQHDEATGQPPGGKDVPADLVLRSGDTRSIAHLLRLQHALEHSNVLAEQLRARSLTLLSERDEASLIAASEIARLSRETEALRSSTVTKHLDFKFQIAQQEDAYTTVVDLLRDSKAYFDVRSNESEQKISDLVGELEAIRSALSKAENLSADFRAENAEIHQELSSLKVIYRTEVSTKIDHERRINSQSFELDQVNQRIRDFVDSRSSAWERLGAFLRLHRKPDAFRNLVKWHAAERQGSGSRHWNCDLDPLKDYMSQYSETEDRDPFLRASSIEESLSWNDLDFVRCAYVTILGRQPDLSGQAHFVQLIRAGASKLDVLWRLRRSPEGKQHDPGIAGLDRALKRAAWQRRPLLGAISRVLDSDADGGSPSDRALRVLTNVTAVNQRYLHAIAERITATPGLSGLQASSPAEPTLADRTSRSATRREEQGTSADLTPELDHLRRRAIIGRFTGDGAP